MCKWHETKCVKNFHHLNTIIGLGDWYETRGKETQIKLQDIITFQIIEIKKKDQVLVQSYLICVAIMA